MKTSQFVASVVLKATGKPSTLVSGDTKWNKILGIGNFYIDAWQDEKEVDWNSLYDPLYNLGSVTATDTFTLSSEIRKLSDTPGDKVVIFHADGVNYTTYDVVPADTLKNYYAGQNKESSYGNCCAQIGNTLVFNHTFRTTDPQFGGTIRVPIYKFARHLVRDGDSVPVDIPNWLILMTAAEYVRNDVTRQNQYPNLIGEANEVMDSMIVNNDAQVEKVHQPWAPLGQTWA